MIKLTFGIFLLCCGLAIMTLGGYMAKDGWDELNNKNNNNKKIEVVGNNNVVINNEGQLEFKSFEKIFVNNKNEKIDDFKEVGVLEDKIIDAQKGYMRIKVSKNYLNSGFDMPVTLKYKSGRYQPVMLTFTNDKKWGAGVIFTSPEYERRSSIYLNQCIRFEGFGKMTYTKDLIFELYFNDYCIYFITNSGEVKFERQLPPIRYGKQKCIGYFEENNEKNKQASADFSELEAYFKKYK